MALPLPWPRDCLLCKLIAKVRCYSPQALTLSVLEKQLQSVTLAIPTQELGLSLNVQANGDAV